MKLVAVISSIILGASFFTQKEEPIKITWDDLADVEYEEVYLEEMDAWYWKPIFGEKVKSYDGKLVSIKGYYKSLADSMNYLTHKNGFFGGCGISKNNNDSHEVIQLDYSYLKTEIQSKRAQLNGVLKLNSEDVFSHIYILDPKEIKELE